ncbi:MAG TPA: adenylate/guanylate cyclase domain-containing protein, partial [Polyangiaceae bacterium]
RDIKPQNVMVSDTGSQSHIKLLDFGIGTILHVGDAGRTDLTRTGEFIGTPGYAAPEQLRGEAVGPKSDLYAWGLLFLECLTGVPAVRAPNLASLLHQQLSGAEVALPPSIAAHGIGALLRRVLRKDHRDRAGDAGALFAELAQIDLHELVVPPPAPADGADRTGRAEMTQGTVADWEAAGARARRSQITAMSWSVDLDAASDAADPEAMETLARDQLNLTKDAVTRFGGVIVGALGNRVMAFFGYPTQYDFAARSAATAALAVAEEVARRNRELAASGLGVEVRIGIHTGSVVISGRDAPMGPTPNFAMRLEGLAQPGEILVSEPTRQLLAEHMTLETMSAPAGETLTHRLLGRRVEVDPGAVPPSVRVLLGRTRERDAMLAFWSEAAREDRRVPSALLLRGSAG